MPARSVAFANLRGGCGKSTILFQLASEFAKAHASTRVLVIDCTAFGDVSRLLLGGRQPHVKAAVAERHASGQSTHHLLSHLAAAPLGTATAGDAGGSPQRAQRGAASWAAGSVNVAERFALRASQVNPHIPTPNLMLVPSGATKQQPCTGLARADVLRLARTLRARLDALPGDWQASLGCVVLPASLERGASKRSVPSCAAVFFDTDGDLTFSPATEVALRAADLCYIPYQPTESDHDRATEAVLRMQRMQPPGATVGGVIYNMVAPEPRATSQGWAPYSASFRPHEVAVRRMVADFSADWWGRAQAQPASFAATSPAEAGDAVPPQDAEQFALGSVMLMQDFGKPGNLAAELGIPFCAMDGAKRYRVGDHTESLGGSKKLAAVEANMQELRTLIEAAQVRVAARSTAELDSHWEPAATQPAAGEQPCAQQEQQQEQRHQEQQQPAMAVAMEAAQAASPQQQGRETDGGSGSVAALALAAAALVAVAPAAAPAAALAAAVIASKQWLRN